MCNAGIGILCVAEVLVSPMDWDSLGTGEEQKEMKKENSKKYEKEKRRKKKEYIQLMPCIWSWYSCYLIDLINP